MIARVDERHGRVNRSIHILSASSAARVLYHDGYASTALGTPKNERALLRIAVDWCSQPNRASADIKRIMSEINFTGLPPYTLVFMDRNPDRTFPAAFTKYSNAPSPALRACSSSVWHNSEL